MKTDKRMPEAAADAEQLYRDYKDRVYQYIKNRTNSPETAEDLLSSVFLKIYERLDTYDSSRASLSTWIYAVTRNTLNDYLRRKYKGIELKPYAEALADCADEDVPAVERIIRQEQLEKLSAALERLPQRERDIIVLRFYYERTALQVADAMGLSHANVRYLQHVAIGKLRELMNT